MPDQTPQTPQTPDPILAACLAAHVAGRRRSRIQRIASTVYVLLMAFVTLWFFLTVLGASHD